MDAAAKAKKSGAAGDATERVGSASGEEEASGDGTHRELEITGVLRAHIESLAAASFRYHSEKRAFAITSRRIAPDGAEQPEWLEGVGGSAAKSEREELAEHEAAFRESLGTLAAKLRYAREDLAEALTFGPSQLSPCAGWERLMDLAGQWEKCTGRLHFPDPYISSLPSAAQVTEIIGETGTLVALLQNFCDAEGLKRPAVN